MPTWQTMVVVSFWIVKAGMCKCAGKILRDFPRKINSFPAKSDLRELVGPLK